ncbi:hypothetical protein ACL6C3_00875 [Capilliphycus salinus ALCB114379]|uniref:hypothetical protein n=1 Tax=Capilliphycus salinus TaxID=2768948 RepID=UPI0039A7247B
MSQSSVVNSSKSKDSLPPVLKGVLGSLDVELEDELSRYRRYRRAQTPTPSVKPSNSYTQKPSEVLSVSEGENNIEPSSAPKPQSKPSGSKTPSGWEAVVVPESAPLARRSATRVQSEPDQSASSFSSSSSSSLQPDGYLESSQNLVKSLEERRARRRQRSWAASLLTPVGIGSMLLFLLSCIGLGYVVMSPSGMATLGLNRWFNKLNPNAQTAGENGDENTVVEPIEPQPNLAAREFVDLDLNTLSNINPSPNPIPTPATPTPPSAGSPSLTPPSPLPSGPGMNNLTNELLPEPVPPTPTPQPTPTPTAAAPTVTPTPAAGAATKPNTDPVRANDNLYYVVTPYSNERSLEKAREVVPDAYVREFKTGVKVQMGALDNPQGAKQLAEELRVQGISVQFDTPRTAE